MFLSVVSTSPARLVRENVRAQLRALVKRILRRHGYPPDKQEKTRRTVLEQAEVLSADWELA
jgi:type I restriction enzyme R subunit